MAQHILIASFVAFALSVGAVAWYARAAGPAPVQFADDSDTGCSDPTPAASIADIRVNSGV